MNRHLRLSLALTVGISAAYLFGVGFAWCNVQAVDWIRANGLERDYRVATGLFFLLVFLWLERGALDRLDAERKKEKKP